MGDLGSKLEREMARAARERQKIISVLREPSDPVPTYIDFRPLAHITEEHRHIIYSARFCDVLPAYYNYFASVSSTAARIYCIDEPHSADGVRLPATVRLVQAFADDLYPTGSEEDNYCSTWATKNDDGTVPMLLFAGKKSCIKGMLLQPPFSVGTLLVGHGNEVYDLKTHPLQSWIVFSASKDCSVRMWNAATSVCVAIFSGIEGHKEMVLCLDCHPKGDVLASVGGDRSVRLWNIASPEITQAIRASDTHPRGQHGNSNFSPLTVQVPLFWTNLIHNSFIDSVKWVGNLLLTRCNNEPVLLWAPDSTRYSNFGMNVADGSCVIPKAYAKLREFLLPNHRFWSGPNIDYCAPLDIFSVGNDDGRIFLHCLTDAAEVPSNRQRPKQSSSSSSSSSRDKTNTANVKMNAADSDGDMNNRVPEKPRAVLKGGNPNKYEKDKDAGTTRCTSFHFLGKFLVTAHDTSGGKGSCINVWEIIGKS